MSCFDFAKSVFFIISYLTKNEKLASKIYKMSSPEEVPTIQFIDFVIQNLKEVYSTNNELSYISLTKLMFLKFDARVKKPLPNLDSTKLRAAPVKDVKRKGPSDAFLLFKASVDPSLSSKEINRMWQALPVSEKSSLDGSPVPPKKILKKKVPKVSIYSDEDKQALMNFVSSGDNLPGEEYIVKYRKMLAIWKDMSPEQMAPFFETSTLTEENDA